ncbi:MAG: CoA ester lyase [Haloarculaceae archaeon]
MDPFRSMLFIPANNEDWVRDAPENFDADGYIFDIEDSVPPGEKQEAREILRDAYSNLEAYDINVTARVNDPDTGFLEQDLKEIVHERLDGIVFPKAMNADQIKHVDSVLTYLEDIRDIDDPVQILIVPETAKGMYNAYELCTASDRVYSISGGTSRGADIQRALNWEWTAEGREKLYMLSKINMEGRAADIPEITGGAWTDIEDVEGLKNEAQMLKEIGYTSYHVIHPSHIEPINEIFTPDEDEVDYYQRLMEEMDRAELEEGRAAVEFEGEMIDIAHIKTGEKVLERARAFDMVD